jgi:Cof subfamily protein (haloacid dehalogenase superfamily)
VIRLLASDLDGTLLRSDGTVSARSRSALQRASCAGLVVAFVTGRPPRWLHEIAEATAHRGIAVAANGAVLYDLADESVVREHLLAPELMRSIAAQLRVAFPEVRFAVEYGMDFAYEPGYRHEWEINPTHDQHGNPIPRPRIADVTEITDRPAAKLLARNYFAHPDAYLHDARALLAGQVTLTHSSNHGLLEISAPGVTKASGLAEVAATHGIVAAEVVAIGDMPNDVPMLEWAGRAYAVANAHPAAIEAADEVLGSNDDDAVAALIESLL